MKASVIVAAIVLLIVSILHLIRVIFQWPATVNNLRIPIWVSVAACIVTAVLAFWLLIGNKICP